MSLWRVIVLAVVQGFAELLPISSSAHVVIAEKLMGMDPSSPETTFLLVMLHTGTTFAVIVYFWKQWRRRFFQSLAAFKRYALLLLVATAITGIVGEMLIKIIESVWFHNVPHPEIEQLFSHLELIAPALALVGVLILVAGIFERQSPSQRASDGPGLELKHAGLIGAVHGLCLPFRGFSRSGATISTGMLAAVPKALAEEFSFALAVLITPPVVVREALRLIHAEHMNSSSGLGSAMMPSLLGAFCAFLVGLLALNWLSRWLEGGWWYLFGIYCLIAGAAVGILHLVGY
jgi:undecaprenyl-diphosphatase